MFSALAVLCAGLATAQLQLADSTTAAPPQKKRIGLAITETLLVNVLVNRANVWAFDEDWARVDLKDWSRNLRFGWLWDENLFSMNMFTHPYHGSMYFNAGRSNGLSFWESIPLTYFGSWTWEFLSEKHRPAINDFFVTSFGGIALGEVSHRISTLIQDNESRGAERIAREFIAAVVNPVGGINRLFRGEWARIGPNPPGHKPDDFFFGLGTGVRNVYEDSTGIGNVAPTILIDINVGDPFGNGYRDPFDVFSVHSQISPGGGNLNAFKASGRLYQTGLSRWGNRVRHDFVVNLRFDYVNNIAYRYGGQNIEIGLISLFPLSKGFNLRTTVAGDLLIMGALSAPFSGVWDRSYDFGPGGGATLAAKIERNGIAYLAFLNRAEYFHSVSGAPADHVIAFSELRGTLPLIQGFGVGFFLSADSRTTWHRGLQKINRQFVETRIFLSWTSARQTVSARNR